MLMSDHIGLRYLFDQLNLNSRKARWLATISKFYFKIRYIEGKENGVENLSANGYMYITWKLRAIMGSTYRIGSCKKYNMMSCIWRLCTCCSMVMVQVQLVVQVQVQVQVHRL